MYMVDNSILVGLSIKEPNTSTYTDEYIVSTKYMYCTVHILLSHKNRDASDLIWDLNATLSQWNQSIYKITYNEGLCKIHIF